MDMEKHMELYFGKKKKYIVVAHASHTVVAHASHGIQEFSP